MGPQVKLTGPIELIKQAWQLFAKLPVKFIGVILVIYIPILAMVLLGVLGSFVKIPTVVTIVLMIILVLIMIALGLLMSPALFLLTDKPSREVKVKDLYKRAVPFFWGFLLVSILTGAAEMTGALFFVIPGILLAIWLILAPVVLVLENKRGWLALRRSKELVTGYWWATLGRFIVLYLFFLLARVPAFILYGVSGVVGRNLTGKILGWVGTLYDIVAVFVFAAMSMIFMVLIYKDLVKRKGATKLVTWSTVKKTLITIAVLLVTILFIAGIIYIPFATLKNAGYSLDDLSSPSSLIEQRLSEDLDLTEEEQMDWEAFMEQMEQLEDYDLEDLEDVDWEDLDIEDLDLDYEGAL